MGEHRNGKKERGGHEDTLKKGRISEKERGRTTATEKR